MGKRKGRKRTKPIRETVWESIKKRFDLDDDIQPYTNEMVAGQATQLAEHLRLLADEIEATGVLFWTGKLLIDSLGQDVIGGIKANLPGRWRMLDICWLLAEAAEESDDADNQV